MRAWCSQIAAEKRREFRDETYWARPVPNFGDPEATGLIVGLAPAAHGANRTGRMFTGDRSGEWLYRALHRVGLASAPESKHPEDGLRLLGVMITAVAHCAPPENRPNRDEIESCRPFLLRALEARPWRGVLCLGGVAWTETLRTLGIAGAPRFAHGQEFAPDHGPWLLASYHPSQQNTFTGRLTEPMFDEVVSRFRSAIH